jgi:hypothetical protein
VRLGAAGPADPLALKLRLGTLYFDEAWEPGASASISSRTCSDLDTGNREARDLVEKTLEIPELREAIRSRPRARLRRQGRGA